jgi:holo-[acyl-carrier protein] synthase
VSGPGGQGAGDLEASVRAALGGRCAVGIDLVDIDEVERSIAALGDAYLERLFTEHERASCTGSPRTRASSFAARFAAKEAALKVLAPDGARPEWRSIEVVRLPHGACQLRLHGAAAALAEAAGLGSFSVSLTHEGNLAAAVVVGERVAPAAGIAQVASGRHHNGRPAAPGRGSRRHDRREGDR